MRASDTQTHIQTTHAGQIWPPLSFLSVVSLCLFVSLFRFLSCSPDPDLQLIGSFFLTAAVVVVIVLVATVIVVVLVVVMDGGLHSYSIRAIPV